LKQVDKPGESTNQKPDDADACSLRLDKVQDEAYYTPEISNPKNLPVCDRVL
jgi:hypothetical protein